MPTSDSNISEKLNSNDGQENQSAKTKAMHCAQSIEANGTLFTGYSYHQVKIQNKNSTTTAIITHTERSLKSR